MAFFEYGTTRYPPATGCGSPPQHIPRQPSGTHIPPRLVSFFENRSVDEHSVEIGPLRANGFPLETYAGIQSLYIILGITRPHPTCSRHLERVHRLVGRPPRVPVAERPDRNTCRRIDGTSHVLSGIGRSPESVLRSEDCSHIESPRVKNIDQMPFADPRSMIRKQGHTLPCKPGIIHRRIGRTDPYGLRRNRADRIRQ